MGMKKLTARFVDRIKELGKYYRPIIFS